MRDEQGIQTESFNKYISRIRDNKSFSKRAQETNEYRKSEPMTCAKCQHEKDRAMVKDERTQRRRRTADRRLCVCVSPCSDVTRKVTLGWHRLPRAHSASLGTVREGQTPIPPVSIPFEVLRVTERRRPVISRTRSRNRRLNKETEEREIKKSQSGKGRERGDWWESLIVKV